MKRVYLAIQNPDCKVLGAFKSKNECKRFINDYEDSHEKNRKVKRYRKDFRDLREDKANPRLEDIGYVEFLYSYIFEPSYLVISHTVPDIDEEYPKTLYLGKLHFRGDPVCIDYVYSEEDNLRGAIVYHLEVLMKRPTLSGLYYYTEEKINLK